MRIQTLMAKIVKPLKPGVFEALASVLGDHASP